MSEDALPKVPCAVEAEVAVLAAMMLSPSAIEEAGAVLRGADFHVRAHRIVFEAIMALSETTTTVDVMLVAQQLRDTGRLEDAGGAAYLAEIIDAVPTAAHVSAHASVVANKARLRDIIEASGEAMRAAYLDNGRSPEKVLAEAEERLGRILRDGASGYRPLREALFAAMEAIEEEAEAKGGLTGLSTGFPTLDGLTAGLHVGDLTILGGRPSMGKSALAWCMVIAAAKEAGVAVASLEMTEAQLTKRGLSMRSGVGLQQIRRGSLDADDYRRLTRAMADLDKMPVWIDDRPAGTLFDLRAKLRRLTARTRIGLVVVDYLQLMEADGESRVQQMSTISRGLKHVARDYGLHVLALSQLSRAVEQRAPPRPRLSDLRDSGSIEQDADNVLLLWRPEYYFDDKTKEEQRERWRGRAELIVGKQRNGPTGRVILRFDAETTEFREMTLQEATG